jgi:hypothetical protein
MKLLAIYMHVFHGGGGWVSLLVMTVILVVGWWLWNYWMNKD